MYSVNINIEDAAPGMVLAESVYVENSAGVKMLAARKGAMLVGDVIRVLQNRGVKIINIVSIVPPNENLEEEILPAAAQKPTASVAPAPVVPVVTAPAVLSAKPKPEKVVPIKGVVDTKLKEEAVDSIKQLFGCFSAESGINKTTAYQCVENVESVVNDLLNVITDDSTGLVHINDLKQFDEYTYHHSLSVSVLSIAAGSELGLDSGTLFRLGRCAMLHDIGKQLIPHDIINKAGKLTDAEFAMVQNHTILGAASLKKNAIGDVELWNGVMLHHEKMNGTGYPKQLRGKDIPLFSKIIAIADVYDAITSYRSYRSPMLPSDAFDVIFKDAGTAFDFEIVKAFAAKLEPYPANTIIQLSDGKIGIVIQSKKGASKIRPTVRLWGSDEIIALSDEKHRQINITKILNPSDLPEGYELV
ncbi:MAG: HD-GYP domain-containing protein [Clostridiales bacterium]|jgi:putative nucleotidyltransferase with HDIG domain|nr:HD-GYP domain-containing protein [Clostridiales bacterium]